MSFFKRFLDSGRSPDAEQQTEVTRSGEDFVEDTEPDDGYFDEDEEEEDDDEEFEPEGPVVFEPNGSIRFNISSVVEAKLAMKELRLAKKELNAEKRAINESRRQVQAAYTDKVRSRGQMMRGGGSIGRFVRGVQSSSRSADRQRHAKNLAPYEDARSFIEARIHTVDRAMLQIERYIMENDTPRRK